MNKETITAAANGAANGATSAMGITSSWWLWLTDPNAAHLVTFLTVILILSQLIWGWKKFFKESK